MALVSNEIYTNCAVLAQNQTNLVYFRELCLVTRNEMVRSMPHCGFDTTAQSPCKLMLKWFYACIVEASVTNVPFNIETS